MPGLPCDTCQEDSSYVLNGEDLDDATGQTYFRRFRVCTNPRCPKFMHRRISVEYYPEDQGKPKVYQPDEFNRLRRAMGMYKPGTFADDASPLLPWDFLD